MSFFYYQYISGYKIPLKILFYATGNSAYEYEYTYHLLCLNNSYYADICAALCGIGVCCNSPLLGRKG